MTTTFSLLIIRNEIVRKVALKDDETTVGRDAKMDILISDPAISRRQFTIIQRGDHIFVEMNPQSRYQAVKGGQPKRQLELYPGERFELGPYRFEIEAHVALPQAQRGPLDLQAARQGRLAGAGQPHGQEQRRCVHVSSSSDGAHHGLPSSWPRAGHVVDVVRCETA